MINFLRHLIPDHHPLRLFYHRILAFAAAVRYGFPSRHLRVIAVTGTGGKSTTCHFIAHILREAGHKVGLATTIGFWIGDREVVNDTKMTTVGRFALQKLLRQMVDVGCDYAVIEATSHALSQFRIDFISPDIALLTNVYPEHVEYHGGFEDYIQAKGKLFSLLCKSFLKSSHLQFSHHKKIAILNRDDPHCDFFASLLKSFSEKVDVYFYGLNENVLNENEQNQNRRNEKKQFHFSASSIQESKNGISFVLNFPHDTLHIQLSMLGIFNVYNAVAAAACTLTEGIRSDIVASALKNISSLPGRFEEIDDGQPFRVVVDYAHTAHALEGLLKTYRGLTAGRIFVVFGAPGGGRDKSKRPKMGAAAHQFADYIVLTSDDPYEEDEHDIIRMVAEGIPREEGADFEKISDRRLAISRAISLAKEGDTVIIAGKGCEPVQMIYGERKVWDDREVAREILRKIV